MTTVCAICIAVIQEGHRTPDGRVICTDCASTPRGKELLRGKA